MCLGETQIVIYSIMETKEDKINLVSTVAMKTILLN